MSRSGSLWEGALELLSQARSLTIPPNAKSFGAALSACKEHWEASLALLESMQKVEAGNVWKPTLTTALIISWP